MREIWQGYLQVTLSDGARLLYLLVDLFLAGLLSFGLLQVANSPKGTRFFSYVIGACGLLIGTSYLALPGLHLLAQALLILLLVSFPIVFHQEWQGLFEKNEQISTSPLSLATKIGLSLLVGLAVVAVTTGSATRVGQIPQEIIIQAVNAPDGTAARVSGSQKVKVTVSAPRDSWKAITSETLSATVDLAKQGEGTYDLPISVTSRLSNVKILRSSPSRAFVSVEPVIKKTVPVSVRFSGKAGDDLVPDRPKITPEKVEISGPKSVVADLTQAIAIVTLSGETKPLALKVPLKAEAVNGDEIAGVTFSPPEVDLSVALVKAGKIKTVGIKPVISGQPATGFWVKSVTATPAVVAVTGSAEQLNALTEIATSAYSITGLTTDSEQQVTLSLPSGITSAEGLTKVTIKITLAKTETTKSITPELVYVGLAEALKVTTLSPTSISVIIAGNSDTITALSASSVKINLDLSAYKSAGSYSLKIKNSDFILPEGITLVSFLPSAIDVTLENR